MIFARETLRYVFVSTANHIPRFHTLDFVRTSILRWAGLKIGEKSRISGHLVLEFSLRRATVKHISIGNDCFLGYNCRISASKAEVFIGNKCNIGPNVSIETAGHWFNRKADKRHSYHKPVTIEDNVWIGAGCIILPGVTIGRNSIVAAGAVVAKDVAEGLLVGGVPARTIKPLADFSARSEPAPTDRAASEAVRGIEVGA